MVAHAAALFQRLIGSAVVWSWMFNGLRLASGILLLPLLTRTLTDPDLGMYYTFLPLALVVPMMDFGFALSIERSLAYALAGARRLEVQGVGPDRSEGPPNLALVGEIVVSARQLYRGLAGGAFLLLAVVGTAAVGLEASATSNPSWTWAAWAVNAVGLALELYTAYWVAVLRGLNRVMVSARWMSIAYGIKLVLSIVLLKLGWGLMAIPAAGLTTGIIVRAGVGREVMRWLAREGVTLSRHEADGRRLAGLLWPNSWRLGIQLVALFLSGLASVSLCTHRFGIATTGVYGLSVQLMNIAMGISGVWTAVKWPLVSQLRARDDRAGMRRVLRPRMLLQFGTFLLLAGSAVVLADDALRWGRIDKQVLGTALLALLALDALGQLHFSFWTTVISTENRIPAVWALVGTHAVNLVVMTVLLLGFRTGIETLIVTPLITGCLFNYWWWAREGTRVLGTTLPRFLAGR